MKRLRIIIFVVLCLPLTIVAQQAYYPFTGNARDSSGNANHAEITDATLDKDRCGEDNSAYRFNGTNNYIILPDDFDYKSRTISLWFQTDNLNQTQIIYSSDHPELKNGSTVISIEKTDVTDKANIVFSMHGGETVGENNVYKKELTDNKWHHIAMIIEESFYFTVFIDGVNANIQKFPFPSVSTATNILATLGTSSNTTDFFEGRIDEVYIYDRVLLADEVLKLYNPEVILPSIVIGDAEGKVGDVVEVAISTSLINKCDNLTSFYIEMAYDDDIIEYRNYTISGLSADGGSVEVNAGVDNLLKISYTNTDPISGEGDLIIIRFNAIGKGITQLTPNKFNFNTNPVFYKTEGTVTIYTDAEPQKPTLQSVSVNNNGEVELTWEVNLADDMSGFYIYRAVYGVDGVSEGSEQIIAEVTGGNTTTWTDNSTRYGTATPTTRSEAYRVASFVVVMTDTANSVWSTQHKTILLAPPVFDKCASTNTLTWSAYEGWDTQLSTYRIMAKEGEIGEYKNVGETTHTTYAHSLDVAGTYYYKIIAIHTDGTTAQSNIVSTESAVQSAPKYISANYANVASGNVELSFTIPENQITNYRLDRIIDGTTTEISTFQNPTNTLTYIDEAPAPAIYGYQLSAINDCNTEVKQSNIIYTQNPQVTKELEIVNITWDIIIGWLGDNKGYKLYRTVNGKNAESLGDFLPNQKTYTDKVSTLVTSGTTEICYYIVATETDNPYEKNASQTSFSQCVEFEKDIFLPNAFNPNNTGINGSFKPEVPVPDDYELMIFNRWGEKIFESTDPEIGWDGTRNGKLVERGVYGYYLKYTGTSGTIKEKRSFVMLMYE